MLQDVQKTIERLYNKNQKYPLIERELLQTHQIVNIIKLNFLEKKDFEAVINILVTLVLMKNVSIQSFLETIHKTGVDDFEYNLNIIFKCYKAKLLNLDSNGRGIRIISIIVIPDEIQELIDRYQYLPPMLVKPLKLYTNKCSGYLTIKHDSLILQKGNHHNKDINLDHLNVMNNIDLCLDERVIRTIRDTQGHLDSQKETETIEEYQNRVKNFLRLEASSFLVFALLINNGNNFNLTHKYDKRGRCYSQGYHCNYQGNSFRKAIIQLANKEVIPLD